jgi:hypothetical protein
MSRSFSSRLLSSFNFGPPVIRCSLQISSERLRISSDGPTKGMDASIRSSELSINDSQRRVAKGCTCKEKHDYLEMECCDEGNESGLVAVHDNETKNCEMGSVTEACSLELDKESDKEFESGEEIVWA